MADTQHAWYSREHEMAFGSCKWKRESGEIVTVTCVADSGDYCPREYRWKDSVYVGMVAKVHEPNLLEVRRQRANRRLMDSPGGLTILYVRLLKEVAAMKAHDELKSLARGDAPNA